MQAPGTWSDDEFEPNLTSELHVTRTTAPNRIDGDLTRTLSMRLITQYNDFTCRLELEPPVTYQPNPFTIFNVGSTHDLDSFDAYGRVETERQFFLKMSYLLRP